MKSQKVYFKNKKGDKLSGNLDLPENSNPHEFAIFAHCFTCSKNLTAVHTISKALCLYGIAVLRFDFTGLGESEGDFSDSGFSSNVSDLIAAGEFLMNNYESPSLAIGHSLGGTAILMAAHKIDSLKAIVTIGSPADPEHVKHLLVEGMESIKKNGKSKVNLSGREFTITEEFIEDLEKFNPIEQLKNLNKSLLIMHSPQDRVVAIDHAAEIYHAGRHPKSFISLNKADHMLNDKEDSFYAGELISAWVKRYIDLPQVVQIKTVDADSIE